MAVAVLPWLTIGMGVLVSPDHLRMWGNLAGAAGSGFWMAVLMAAAVYAPTAAGYRRLAGLASDDGNYLRGLDRLGGTAAVALAVASRFTLATGIATGVLVTEGFVFNETFVYWFPNFGFAFLGLAGVTLMLLLGYAMAERVQAALLAITLTGLIFLSVKGLWQTGAAGAITAQTEPGIDLKTVATGLLLFVGFDLGIHRGGGGQPNWAMPMLLISTTLLLGIWGSASLIHVSADRLADTTIPYTLTARRIGGQTGRTLMGIVLIAGSLGAVTALFSATGRLIGETARMRQIAALFRGSDRRNVAAIALLTGTVAVMMALGVAGSPNLEIFIRAGFILWLLHLFLVNVLAGIANPSAEPAGQRTSSVLVRCAVRTASLLLGMAVVYLWIGDAARWRLLAFVITVWLAVGGLLAVGRQLNDHHRRTPD